MNKVSRCTAQPVESCQLEELLDYFIEREDSRSHLEAHLRIGDAGTDFVQSHFYAMPSARLLGQIDRLPGSSLPQTTEYA